MDLKEGMYVRTNDGFIDKVIIDYKGCCNNPNCNCKHVSCEKNYYDEEKIIKTSYNLIDLIEEGDYVNGYKVTAIYNPNGDDIFNFALIMEHGYKTINPYIRHYPIKSIVTKEQFASVKYEVE